MCKVWILALAIAGLTGWASCQSSPANVPRPVVTAKLGAPANFSCDSHRVPLTLCLWEQQKGDGGRGDIIQIFPGQDKNGQETRVRGYSYLGDGLDSGQCGLRIENVRETDNGRWTCTLISRNGANPGSVEVSILKKPDVPKFDIKELGSLNDGDTKRITCYTSNGQPTPKFQWFIDNATLDTGLGQVVNQAASQSAPETTYQQLTHTFSWQESGKRLRCLTVSEALSPEDKNEISMDIRVTYFPRAPQNKVNVKVPELGTRAPIAINISANPEPTIFWTIGPQNLRINSGFSSPDQRFQAKIPVRVAPDLYLCELIIGSVIEEDLNNVYKLTAENQLGSGSFELRLSSDAEPSGGLSTGGIVGLVLGIPVILILIALIVVYARAKGLLCFSGDDGTSSEKERMDGDGDSNKGAAAEEKPTISSRLSAFYENLMKKKDKTAPVDEEANKEKEKDVPEEKKPADIVYAELDLARNETAAVPSVVRCSDDKTEYAEIVGVVPPGDQVKVEKEKKSPTSSNNTSPKK